MNTAEGLSICHRNEDVQDQEETRKRLALFPYFAGGGCNKQSKARGTNEGCRMLRRRRLSPPPETPSSSLTLLFHPVPDEMLSDTATGCLLLSPSANMHARTHIPLQHTHSHTYLEREKKKNQSRATLQRFTHRSFFRLHKQKLIPAELYVHTFNGLLLLMLFSKVPHRAPIFYTAAKGNHKEHKQQRFNQKDLTLMYDWGGGG